jgi:hypothetical protein
MFKRLNGSVNKPYEGRNASIGLYWIVLDWSDERGLKCTNISLRFVTNIAYIHGHRHALADAAPAAARLRPRGRLHRLQRKTRTQASLRVCAELATVDPNLLWVATVDLSLP